MARFFYRLGLSRFWFPPLQDRKFNKIIGWWELLGQFARANYFRQSKLSLLEQTFFALAKLAKQPAAPTHCNVTHNHRTTSYLLKPFALLCRLSDTRCNKGKPGCWALFWAFSTVDPLSIKQGKIDAQDKRKKNEPKVVLYEIGRMASS